ncbi:MAG: SIS domain-containing protein [Gemmatimonadetes bacterium]|nr:SIS domain-containing protein [Gemmatimonadota bacterium]
MSETTKLVDGDCGRELFAAKYLRNLCSVLEKLLTGDLVRALKVLEKASVERRRVFIAGNGGSAATASHMANDLLNGTRGQNSPSVRSIALSDNVSLITAIANDEDYKEIFARQLETLAEPDDVLIVFSGSGNSSNIVRAVEVAIEKKMTTVGFLGMGGGRVAKLVDVAVIVPSNEYGPIEDVHMVFNHLVTAYLCRWCGKSEEGVDDAQR